MSESHKHLMKSPEYWKGHADQLAHEVTSLLIRGDHHDSVMPILLGQRIMAVYLKLGQGAAFDALRAELLPLIDLLRNRYPFALLPPSSSLREYGDKFDPDLWQLFWPEACRHLTDEELFTPQLTYLVEITKDTQKAWEEACSQEDSPGPMILTCIYSLPEQLDEIRERLFRIQKHLMQRNQCEAAFLVKVQEAIDHATQVYRRIEHLDPRSLYHRIIVTPEGTPNV